MRTLIAVATLSAALLLVGSAALATEPEHEGLKLDEPGAFTYRPATQVEQERLIWAEEADVDIVGLDVRD
jgi:hypothetical protein